MSFLTKDGCKQNLWKQGEDEGWYAFKRRSRFADVIEPSEGDYAKYIKACHALLTRKERGLDEGIEQTKKEAKTFAKEDNCLRCIFMEAESLFSLKNVDKKRDCRSLVSCTLSNLQRTKIQIANYTTHTVKLSERNLLIDGARIKTFDGSEFDHQIVVLEGQNGVVTLLKSKHELKSFRYIDGLNKEEYAIDLDGHSARLVASTSKWIPRYC